MRGLADGLLRRRQPDPGAHRPRQPGSWFGHRRPDGLRQPAEHDQVDRLQPSFQQAPDEDAGMLDAAASAQRAPAADHRAFQHRVQQPRQDAAAQVRHQRQRVPHLGEAIGERLAFLARPKAEPGPLCRRWRPDVRRPRSPRPSASAASISIAESIRSAGSRQRSSRDRNAAWSDEAGRLAYRTTHAQPGDPGADPAGRAFPASGPPAGRRLDLSPAAESGCFSRANSGTGASSSATARTSRRRNTAGGVVGQRFARRCRRRRCRSAAARPPPGRPDRDPASPVRPARPASPAPRAAPARSPGPPAADPPCVSRDSPSSGTGVAIHPVVQCDWPATGRGTAAGTGSAGRRSPHRLAMAGRRREWRPGPTSRRASPAWACEASSPAQASSSIPRSSCGSTTCPIGIRATTRSRRATAGMPAVVPAISTGWSGGSASQAAPGRPAARPGGRPGSSRHSRPASRARSR